VINLTQFGPTGQRVCLTLTEAAPCGYTGAWAFLLESPVTGATVLFTAPDISSSLTRYNEFVWQSVGATGVDLSDGRVYLPDSGTYEYTAYQAVIEPERMVVSGAGTTGIDGTYLADGTFNGYPMWTKAGGTSQQDSIYVGSLAPQELWMLTTGGSYAQNPLNVKYYNFTSEGVTANGGAPTVWLQASGGDDPPPSVTFTAGSFTLGQVVETGRLTLHKNPDTPLPDYTAGEVTVIPTFGD